MNKKITRRTFTKASIAGAAVFAVGPGRVACASDPDNGLKGFHPQITELNTAAGSQPTDLSRNAPETPDIDLVGMASWALRALRKNPRPNLNYECRFAMRPLQYPPGPGPNTHDPITAGDTENRIDWEFGYMKEMCGNTSADEVAKGVRKRILGHLRDDGLCWVTTGAFAALPGLWASHWTTAKLLVSFCDDYRRTGDESLRPQCRKMFKAMAARADWVDGRAYYAGGNSCWNEKGWAITDSTPYSPAMLLVGIVKYYETFHDEEALEFAVAFAEGEMAQDQWHNWIMKDPSKLTPEQKEQMKLTSSMQKVWPTAPMEVKLAVRPDGSFDHHSHLRGHNGWGMAYLASITKEPRLVAWCKRLLDFYLMRGTDYGWIPESMTYPWRSETCVVADVISMATYMAKCGYPEYWDTVERFVRNYIREAQFFVTPEFEKIYRKLHPGKEGEKGLAMVRDFQGGFQGAMGVSDRCFHGTDMDMMGCCMPEGMRSIYTAWSNTIIEEEDGVYINMSFDRDAPQAKVVSFLPFEGRMSVWAKVPGRFHLRLPAWVHRNNVKINRNGKPVALAWQNGYACFDEVTRGEELTVTYPLLSFIQKQKVNAKPVQDITVTWLGNTVMKLMPPRGPLPLYRQVPRPLPSLPKSA